MIRSFNSEIQMNRRHTHLARLIGAAALAASGVVHAADAEAPRETVAPAFAHAIANVPGKTLTALVVTYPPGGTTPAHRHGKSFVVGYVLEGAIRSRLGDGKEQVFHAGESWTETPGAHHTVSGNASSTEPAKMLAIFVADSKDKDLVKLDPK